MIKNIFEKFNKFSKNEDFFDDILTEDELADMIRELNLPIEKEDEYIENINNDVYDLDVMAVLIKQLNVDLLCLLENWDDKVHIVSADDLWELFVEQVENAKYEITKLFEKKISESDYGEFIDPNDEFGDIFASKLREIYSANDEYADYVGYTWVDEKGVYTEC